LSRETTERVRRLVHGEGQPIKTISMDVFAMTVRDSRAGRIEKQVIAIRFTI